MISLTDFKNEMAREIFGKTITEAKETGLCILCEKPAKYYSDAGRREYAISGMCERCFDACSS